MMRYGIAHNRDFAHEHYTFFKELTEQIPDYQNKRILEIGCGKSFWLTLLLHSSGAKITGVDTELVTGKTGAGKYIGIFLENGLERTLRTMVWDILFAKKYYAELEKYCPFKLEFNGIDVRCVNALSLDDFDNDTFDLIVSHEVFEHINDIPATLEAIHRVLKKNGSTYIYIHNYTSLSGGHHIAWKYPDTEPSKVVPPWDHLRDNHYPDIPSWINRMREYEYRREFEKLFNIIDWKPGKKEGEKLLTQQLRQELIEYNEDELLTKGFVVVAKPIK